MIYTLLLIIIVLTINNFYLLRILLTLFMNITLSKYCNNSAFFTHKEKQEIFPMSQYIESNYLSIRSDYINYKPPIKPFFEMLPDFFVGDKEKQIKENKFWKLLPIKTTGKIIQSNHKFFPSLHPILSNPSIHNVFFSVLDPNVCIPPHYGPYKGYLRYHLGLIVPEENGKKPFIVVDNQKYFWKEGEGIMFDDFYEHYVENPTSQQRVVLFIDVVRPLKGFIDKLNKIGIFLIENDPKLKEIQEIQHKSVKI